MHERQIAISMFFDDTGGKSDSRGKSGGSGWAMYLLLPSAPARWSLAAKGWKRTSVGKDPLLAEWTAMADTFKFTSTVAQLGTISLTPSDARQASYDIV